MPTTPASYDKLVHPDVSAFDLASIMRAVGDPVRLETVRILTRDGEHTCSELADALGLPNSTCSYHLKHLRDAGITRARAEGTVRYVSLRRDDLESRFPGLLDVLTQG